MRLHIGIITFFPFFFFVTLASFEAAAVPRGIAAKLSRRMPLIRSLQRALQARFIPLYYDEEPLSSHQLIDHLSAVPDRLSVDCQLLLLFGLTADAHKQQKLLSEVIRDTPLARTYFESLCVESRLLSRLAE